METELFKIENEKVTNSYALMNGFTSLKSWDMNFPNTTDASFLFCGCSNLESVNCDCPNAKKTTSMFNGCNKLTSVTSDIHSATDTRAMFYNCQKLKQIPSNLTYHNCDMMFYNCLALNTFDKNLGNVRYCSEMFAVDVNNRWNALYFYPSTTYNSSNLSSIYGADKMFNYRKISSLSLVNVFNTFNYRSENATVKLGYIHVGSSTEFNWLKNKGTVEKAYYTVDNQPLYIFKASDVSGGKWEFHFIYDPNATPSPSLDFNN